MLPLSIVMVLYYCDSEIRRNVATLSTYILIFVVMMTHRDGFDSDQSLAWLS